MIVEKDNNILIKRLELGQYGTNAYIVVCKKTNDSLIIDAPANANVLIDNLKGTNPKYILLTHNHMDHTGALSELRSKLQIPLATHTLDTDNLAPKPELLLSNGDDLSCGNLNFKILHTPGHTLGSLCFCISNYLISGDTVFPGGPGKTKSPDAFRQIIKSITEKIFTFSDSTIIYPGHGQSTTVKKAKEEYNVFSTRSHDANLHGDILWLTS
ncbi:MAG: MBL fold metallo-hydrolase [Dehalococcoidales bacterium]|nr:MBL fold metallo-hydrolase [Dehalococcoidales bacterium]